MYLIYGMNGCTNCEKAKALLKNEEFKYLKMGVDYGLTEFQQAGNGVHKSFPLILHDGKYVGGFEQLVEYLK